MFQILETIINRFAAGPCPGSSNFLWFPTWYRGLQCDSDGGVMFTDLNNVWVVVANVMDITIRLAGLMAVIFLIYGGIRYITSQGEPDNLNAAKRTVTYAVVGLVIAILASTLIGFIAGIF